MESILVSAKVCKNILDDHLDREIEQMYEVFMKALQESLPRIANELSDYQYTRMPLTRLKACLEILLDKNYEEYPFYSIIELYYHIRNIIEKCGIVKGLVT